MDQLALRLLAFADRSRLAMGRNSLQSILVGEGHQGPLLRFYLKTQHLTPENIDADTKPARKRPPADAEHRKGSMWGAYMAGWIAATKRAGDMHEQISPASDDERLKDVPGAGAMGAVIEYRDTIRKQHP